MFAALAGDAGRALEFGEVVKAPLDPALDQLRIAATNRAFQALAAVSSAICLIAAATAWFTQPEGKA